MKTNSQERTCKPAAKRHTSSTRRNSQKVPRMEEPIKTQQDNESYKDKTAQQKSKVFITREALSQILATIGKRRPETGGILLGPIGRDGISKFVFDSEGDNSFAAYGPSSEQLSDLCEQETSRGIELKGFCHSHPGGFASPSGGDMYYVQRFFDANPSMTTFYMPIMFNVPMSSGFGYPSSMRDTIYIGGRTRMSSSHIDKGQLPDGWQHHLNFYFVERANPETSKIAEIVICEESEFPKLPVAQMENTMTRYGIDSGILCNLLKGRDVSESTIQACGCDILCLNVVDGDTELSVLLPSELPVLQPSLIIGKLGYESFQYRFCWAIDDERDIHERLADLIESALATTSKLY
jgi:hypothetical protein